MEPPGHIVCAGPVLAAGDGFTVMVTVLLFEQLVAVIVSVNV
jgi:hypothetical protein